MSKTKKKAITIAAIAGTVCLIAGIILFVIFGLNRSMMSKLSPGDQETANLYAELYEMPAEEIAKIQVETGDWEETGKQINEMYFTISENVKYQMTHDGYSLDDLEQAERLSEKTGIKAIELAERKGRISDGRQWSDVVSDDEILSIEEQLGLTKQQIEDLKKYRLSKEDRVEIAILLLNEKYSFDEVIKQLDDGKSVEQMKGQDEKQ